ncbi:MAG TPA: 5-methyltetrahydropteroyltriglutamate--homocysteine S-methyltransferase, partial [Acidiferrobacteraceae bacterium]|nr:5-methyltetrahydropteroyltriglutamate--homocysteine S-methyltransferase [Acidiferrobacteraceae bacterium]
MIQAHILGFPRIGADRELKKAVEAYWKGQLTQDALKEAGRGLRERHWALQRQAGLDWVAVGDFAWYDQVLEMSATLGVVPPRFGWTGGDVDLDTYFRMARGTAPTGTPAYACEMTKWFDTNYHYIVPEFQPDQAFRLSSTRLFDQVAEARALGHTVKPVLIGPLTYLWLGKTKGGNTDRLALLERILPVYREILQRLQGLGVDWVQIDEPALALDLPRAWLDAYPRAYAALEGPVKLLVATYFEGIADRADLVARLPVAGWHVDLVRAPAQAVAVAKALKPTQLLSLGVIDGRNIWAADLQKALEQVRAVQTHFKGAVAVAASCSLLHVPVDLERETALDSEMRGWLAFAVQKLDEIQAVRLAAQGDEAAAAAAFRRSQAAVASRRSSKRIHNPAVKQRVAALTEQDARRTSAFPARRAVQQKDLKLPAYPTTTIGSFPQTPAIRNARSEFKAKRLDEAGYRAKMRAEIELAVRKQEEIGIDVLVHGEAERNDMVEYFGEQLEGFVFTQYGWVQSYGSRCVKPPVIFGDVSRPRPMTVEWARYAQSL